MFSSQLGRAVRASSSSLPHTPTTHRTATACLATCATTQFRPKQRRLSSSKASSSPNGSSGSGSNSNGAKPLANTSQPEGTAASKTTSANNTNTGGRRANGRRARDVSGRPSKKTAVADVDGAFEGLPKVAGTGHLHPQDISLSSFFSLHRPLSLTTPLPPLTTQESFASIFESRSKSSQNPQDVIYTLTNTIDSLDADQAQQQAQQQQQDADLQWQILQESPSNADIKHLDGAPRPAKTLEEMVSQLRPFMTPPPPTAQKEKKAKKTSTEASESATPSAAKKSFQTTITVTENTSAEGVKYYTASTSPMVRIAPSSSQQLPAVEESTDERTSASRQPFLERMQQRQMEYQEYREERDEERAMHMISVKRQRKLKMKKHKYKKLMKRTRNLRRRLDRN